LAATRFALVILDVLLPDGDGIELLRQIRADPASGDTAVMLLSTEAEVRNRVKGLKTGADEYVGKPYDAAYVVARAKEIVRRASAASGESPPTILVVDDSPTFRESLRSALESAGYRVVVAESGEEGLHKAADERPSAMIVDGVLPGIDGSTVIRRMREDVALRRVPCLLLTASEERSGEISALRAGADAYVRKEERIEVILARLAAVLRSAKTPAALGQTSGLLGPKRILAVDDSPTYLHQLSDELREEGYEVIQARSGEEALDLLAAQAVDCILLDLLMPGMSGQEACRHIKSKPEWRDIPLIMLTALDEREAMIEGIRLGADDYITKSSDFEVLKARLGAQLRRKQFEDENRLIREELLRKELVEAEARVSKQLAETRAELLAELEKKNKELEAFSYSVSHDLRAPLRAIDGFCQILEEESAPRLDDEGKRHLRVVRENARRMGELIDDLLAFSRMGRQAIQLTDIDMTKLAKDVFEMLRLEGPPRAIRFHGEALPRVQADLSMMRQVLFNLLSNSLKYTAPRDTAEIVMRATENGDETVFSIQDNGVGFDMQYAHRLFGVFQRLHSNDEFAGTGVGLAIVHRIIERHGGRVWAEGKPDRGATFYFTLRRRPA
ncbi:MAG TPA: response regulator, partial [Planctomycetota bacterium]|nr:response regulator [Planctomycetota bacterium]